MEIECKLPAYTLVRTTSQIQSKFVVDYLKKCSLKNPNCYEGSDHCGLYGRKENEIATSVTMNSHNHNIIEYDYFLELIEKSSNEIEENYEIY